MKVISYNASTTIIEDFYRVNTDYYQRKIANDAIMKEFIPNWAKNKRNFYKWLEKSNNKIINNIAAFFSKILIHGELRFKKDFIEFTRKEMRETIELIADEEIFTSRSQYNLYLVIMQYYTRWGYLQDPKLCYEIITAKDFDFGYLEMIDTIHIDNQLLTTDQIRLLTHNLNSCMNEVAILLATEGFEFIEVINLQIATVLNSKNRVINLENRNIKLRTLTFNKLLCICRKTETERRYKGGQSKTVPLADTGYVIRFYANKRSSNAAVNPTVFSNNISKDLDNAGYDGTFKDIRASSMLNRYLDGEDFHKIQDRYDLNFSNETFFKSHYKLKLQLLKLKREAEDSLSK